MSIIDFNQMSSNCIPWKFPQYPTLWDRFCGIRVLLVAGTHADKYFFFCDILYENFYLQTPDITTDVVMNFFIRMKIAQKGIVLLCYATAYLIPIKCICSVVILFHLKIQINLCCLFSPNRFKSIKYQPANE